MQVDGCPLLISSVGKASSVSNMASIEDPENQVSKQVCFEIVKRFDERVKCVLLGFALGLPIYVITTLSKDNATAQEFACGVIEKWLHHYPEKFNIVTLYDALISMEEYALAADMERVSHAAASEPESYHQYRRVVIDHVVKRKEEEIVMRHLQTNKQLIIINGHMECGRTVFLNEIHNRIMTEHADAKIVYYPNSCLGDQGKDLVGGLQELVCPSRGIRGMDALKAELFKQARSFSPFVLIIDLAHSEKSLSSIVLFLDSIFGVDARPPVNLRILVSTCGCSTHSIKNVFQKYPFVAEIILGPLNKEESRQLLRKINPSIDDRLSSRLFEASKGYPAELCILGRISKECEDCETFHRQLDLDPHAELLTAQMVDRQEMDKHLLESMKALNSAEKRGLLAQLLVFPYRFSAPAMIRFTQYCNFQDLRLLADGRFFLLSYDPATQLYCFSTRVRRNLLKIIQNESLFPDEKLFTSHFQRTHSSFCTAHIQFLQTLGKMFLGDQVNIPHDIQKKFPSYGAQSKSNSSVSQLAIVQIKRHCRSILYCINELLSQADINVSTLECLLDVRTYYILQKFAMLRKIISIYRRFLEYLEERPEHAVLAAKAKVCIIFFYSYHLGWKWFCNQAIQMLNEAISVLDGSSEFEALGIARFKLGRLLIAKGVTQCDQSLCDEGRRSYQMGYEEWKKLPEKTSLKVLLAVSHRHEAALASLLDEWEHSNKILENNVFPVYEELDMMKHPFYATACCSQAQLEMHKEDCNLDVAESLLRQSIAIRDRTLGAYHADTVTSFKSLGMCYSLRGKQDKALACFKEAADSAYYVLGATEHTALIFRKLAEAQSLCGHGDEAAASLEQAEKISLEFQRMMENDMFLLVFPDEAEENGFEAEMDTHYPRSKLSCSD